MTYFINFNPTSGVSINTFPNPTAVANEDVRGLVNDILEGRAGRCDLEGAKDMLGDGARWTEDDEEACAMVHDAICDFEVETSAG